jgi:hypothetical protein
VDDLALSDRVFGDDIKLSDILDGLGDFEFGDLSLRGGQPGIMPIEGEPLAESAVVIGRGAKELRRWSGKLFAFQNIFSVILQGVERAALAIEDGFEVYAFNADNFGSFKNF